MGRRDNGRMERKGIMGGEEEGEEGRGGGKDWRLGGWEEGGRRMGVGEEGDEGRGRKGGVGGMEEEW